MKHLIFILLLASVSFANAQSNTRICVQSGNSCIPVDSTAPFPITGSITSSSAATATAAAPSYVEGTSNSLSMNLTGDLRTIAKQSGTWNIGTVTAVTAITNALPSGTNVIGHVIVDTAPSTAVTQGTSPWIVAGSGTAGTAATGVVTVQGIASMTPVQVSQATAGNLNATVVGTGTFVTQSAVTAASGAFASGSHASGAFASGAFASGSFASGSQRVGITPTDRTITSATGSSQTVMSANASRKSLTVVNTGTSNCGINPTGGTAAIGGAGTLTLVPTGSYAPITPTLSAVTAICTGSQPLYADES